jgi:hypothetical protein
MQGIDTLHLIKTLLAQSNLSPRVNIDGQANIIYLHDRIGRFFEPPEGVTSRNILEMARPGIRRVWPGPPENGHRPPGNSP